MNLEVARMHSESDAEAEAALLVDVSEVLNSEQTLRLAAERIVALAEPYVDETCQGVPLVAGFNGDIACRAIVRRAHDSLAATTMAAGSPARANARVHLRTLTEDLIFVKWLLGLDEEVATEYVQRSARVEVLRAIEAQLQFLPVAYKRLKTDVPDLGFSDPARALGQAQEEFANFCRTQGWGKHGPSVRSMAEESELLAEYRFFYFLSSKAVHSNLHEIARMIWGDKRTVSISSNPLAGVHADLAVIYGIWLFAEVVHAVASTFAPIGRLMGSQAYSVWLALILVGPARRGRLPLLIHPEEIR
jgi:hypothetical protein